jgi:hypothetical protein
MKVYLRYYQIVYYHMGHKRPKIIICRDNAFFSLFDYIAKKGKEKMTHKAKHCVSGRVYIQWFILYKSEFAYIPRKQVFEIPYRRNVFR